MSYIQEIINADTFGRSGILRPVSLKFSLFRDVKS